MIEPSLRIVHLTVQRELAAGQREQLRYERLAAGSLDGVQWDTMAVHNGAQIDAFDQAIPFPLKGIILRWLYGWIVALRLGRAYDYVLLRHMPFDPFALFLAPFMRNRIGVHHAKEIEEMPLIAPGLGGRLAALAERFFGQIAVAESAGILGVTSEIADYERELRAPGKPAFRYPNGIDENAVELAPDERSAGSVAAVFICGIFSAWHGLDRLVGSVAAAETIPAGLTIHLIGGLSDTQIASIEELGARAKHFRMHGFLQTEDYAHLMAAADVGIGSLAMDRQNLNEGATLKVRELLAAGVPVWSGHRDTALPADFEYYRIADAISPTGLYDFAQEMKAVTRATVRSAALPLISKRRAMQDVADWIRTLGAA